MLGNVWDVLHGEEELVIETEPALALAAYGPDIYLGSAAGLLAFRLRY